MKATVYSVEGKALKQIDLPDVFEFPRREDLVKRAVLSEESKTYQPKGSYKLAGLETSARYRGRKDDFGSGKNKGISHLPHEVLPKGQLGKVKRVPHAVKGRRAHPPKTQKKIVELMNSKEYKRALASAISFTADRETVCARVHSDIGVSIPIVLEDKFEKLEKTKEVVALLNLLNLSGFIKKAKKNNTKSTLFVVSNGANTKVGANIAGVDIVQVKDLKVCDLAPGTHPGRLTLFSERALPDIVKRFGL
ncbi:50S ribosomal protein L4 [Candidatus Micrarchaeota archaeon]|nr:50S ribosomal protein L4 [Candidatus Micrarchaeota archaeon]MBU1165958.1 50S ribosomal protein L4 [Candidatus Micrarchaeota archaeon]MBU1886862.1 50S ribosomal protein L4 [Candidatus Micrarchaeota archaeon]